MNASARAALLLSLAVLAGCLRRSEPVVFHTLRPLAPRAERVLPGRALEVMPVRLPESLRRAQLVLAGADGGLRLLESHRWGNGLEQDLQRVLAENLARRLGTDSVVCHPDGPRVRAPWRLETEILGLEGRPGGLLKLRVAWMLVPAEGGPAALRRRSDLDEAVPGAGPEALVAAHDRILERLSAEIAAGMAELPAVPK
jgi:uncharacterized lipoprotein YmbA